MRLTIRGYAAIEMPEGSTGKDLAERLNLRNPDQALGMSLNGKTVDLSTPLTPNAEIIFWNFQDPEGKEIFWHTSAHVLAQAVLRLWPEAKPTIGPPIENGFYFDFANLTLSDSDFERIEKEMQAIIDENYKPERIVFANAAEAQKAFSTNPFKVALIQEFQAQELSAYKQGEFFDLCRGPHLPNLGKIKALKILKTAGAYWRGDAQNEMLTRIYGISFPDRKQLKEYLEQLEEAKKRDHKLIGPKLDLFMMKEEAPGIPFILPHGIFIWNQLLNYIRECNGIQHFEIKTPAMMSQELWEISGHWANYRHNMYTLEIEDHAYALKPMNCPGCMLFYKSRSHSYRELPLRIAEVGNVYRNELSGAFSGLFRVRSFHQDDAHIFMKPEDIESEISAALALADKIYSTFGLSYHLELSTRPEKNTIGSDAEWENATAGLRGALEKSGRPYRINEGDGAFYGPKIDIHIRDAIGRTWQCGTIQLDMALPERFDLEYVAQEGGRARPVMIHRAIMGSIERFFGILIEHFYGKFPLWISPRQIRLIPVADRHLPYAQQIAETIRAARFLCDIDESHESVSKKIRTAQLEQFNYMLTLGDKEIENQTIALRTRENQVIGELKLADFLSKITPERDTRALNSAYHV